MNLIYGFRCLILITWLRLTIFIDINAFSFNLISKLLLECLLEIKLQRKLRCIWIYGFLIYKDWYNEISLVFLFRFILVRLCRLLIYFIFNQFLLKKKFYIQVFALQKIPALKNNLHIWELMRIFFSGIYITFIIKHIDVLILHLPEFIII